MQKSSMGIPINRLPEFDWEFWKTTLESKYQAWLDQGILARRGRCLVWTGNVTDDGYPLGRDGQLVHRAIVERLGIAVGPPLEVCHLCGESRCLLPSHLSRDTHGENMKQRDAHGKTAKGEKHGMSKLSDVQRGEIRDRHYSGESYRDIADSYPVSHVQVYRICRAVKG